MSEASKTGSDKERTTISLEKTLSTLLGIVSKINSREKAQQIQHWVFEWFKNQEISFSHIQFFRLSEDEERLLKEIMGKSENTEAQD